MAKWVDPSGVQHNTDNAAYGDQGALPSAPNVSNNAPAAPVYSHGGAMGDAPTPFTSRPLLSSSGGRVTMPNGQQTDFGPGTPYATREQAVTSLGGDGGGGNAPQAPTIPVQAGKQHVNPITGVSTWMSDEDYANLLEQAAEQKRQQGVIETQKQFQIDTDRATQAANAAYQQAVLAGNSATLAATIADNAMRNDITRQQNEATAAYQTGTLANTAQANTAQANQWGAQNLLTGQAQNQQVNQWGQSNMLAGQTQNQATAYQGQQIALQQQSQLADLKRRRPFKTAQIRMT